MGNTKKNLLLGTLLALLSFFSLSVTNAVVKLVSSRIDVPQILFLQNLFSLPIVYLICVFAKIPKNFLRSKHYGLLFLRSIAGLAAFFFVFISVQQLSVANATLLLNTGPFFIPFILWLFFKESIAPRLWLGILPGFIGIMLILNPGSDLFQWIALLPLLSGLSVAIIFISLRRLHQHREPTLRILFYLFLFATLATLPFGIYAWKNPSFEDALFLVLICVTSFLSQTTMTIALRYASPKALAPLCYSSVVFALLFDWLIWKTIPTWQSALGILLVIIGGIIALVIENQSNKNNHIYRAMVK